MYKQCFNNFEFIFCPCVLYVSMKNKTIRKINTGIAMFKIILEFEKKYKKLFTYIHLPPYGISFYLRNVLYSKESFFCLFNFNKTDARICLTEYVLSILYNYLLITRSLCVILSIDLLITMALRFFESQQCAVI